MTLGANHLPGDLITAADMNAVESAVNAATATHYSLLAVHHGADGSNVLSGGFPDPPAMALGLVFLTGEVTMSAGTSLYFEMHSNDPGVRALYELDGTTFGYATIRKVRDAAGAAVSGASWSLGDWTWSTAYGGPSWVGSASPTTDFSIGYGSPPQGVNLLLGGTYRVDCGIYEP